MVIRLGMVTVPPQMNSNMPILLPSTDPQRYRPDGIAAAPPDHARTGHGPSCLPV